MILASGGLEQLLIAATSDSEETLTDEARFVLLLKRIIQECTNAFAFRLTASFVLLHLARNPEAKVGVVVLKKRFRSV